MKSYVVIFCINKCLRWRASGNGKEGEAPPQLKSHVMNPTESTIRRSEARASIYGELQVTSRYRSRTPGGLGPGAQKTSRSGNFEFYQLLLVCLGMGNMETPTTSPLSMAFQLWTSLVWMHCPLLSETLVSETTIDEGHQAMDRRERPP